MTIIFAAFAKRPSAALRFNPPPLDKEFYFVAIGKAFWAAGRPTFLRFHFNLK